MTKRSRFISPETTRLDLSGGDYLIVRTRLNAGEHRAAMARMYRLTPAGERKLDPMQIGITQVIAYLLDWSLTDDEGKPVVIRGLDADALAAVVDNLDPNDYDEIVAVIDAHETAQALARLQEKKLPASTNGDGATSPSPSAAAGASSGFVN